MAACATGYGLNDSMKKLYKEVRGEMKAKGVAVPPGDHPALGPVVTNREFYHTGASAHQPMTERERLVHDARHKKAKGAQPSRAEAVARLKATKRAVRAEAKQRRRLEAKIQDLKALAKQLDKEAASAQPSVIQLSDTTLIG